MSFSVAANDYDCFMGRYSGPLSRVFADFAGVTAGQRVLDVGSGPGALTGELTDRLGEGCVSAVDPSESFVAALRERYPAVQAHRASAEDLPFDEGSFDAALAQLVVHFMSDPTAGLREMARVVRPKGVVAACVWDHAGGRGPLGVFWDAVRQLDPDVADESGLAGARQGALADLFRTSGLRDVEEDLISIDVEHPTFDEWWEPYMLGVGPAGSYVTRLDQESRTRLRTLCREMLPTEPFTVSAGAWAARARAR